VSLLLAGSLVVPTPARAVLHAGAVAPDFRGTSLDGGDSWHLYDFHGQVVVLFVLGSS
jgi:hypothetical protein